MRCALSDFKPLGRVGHRLVISVTRVAIGMMEGFVAKSMGESVCVDSLSSCGAPWSIRPSKASNFPTRGKLTKACRGPYRRRFDVRCVENTTVGVRTPSARYRTIDVWGCTHLSWMMKVQVQINLSGIDYRHVYTRIT